MAIHRHPLRPSERGGPDFGSSAPCMGPRISSPSPISRRLSAVGADSAADHTRYAWTDVVVNESANVVRSSKFANLELACAHVRTTLEPHTLPGAMYPRDVSAKFRLTNVRGPERPTSRSTDCPRTVGLCSRAEARSRKFRISTRPLALAQRYSQQQKRPLWHAMQ
ncbi:hypothetical protein OH76DRAFT_1253985 [Lentinus brumalis]|uniref:Uncharacterized protein n=1 Tax=Lentinus brumalis TaxID=2498619 RepID=A0A371CRH9_9APHY|nr:hypothetical protein OH76DRAFT_1253985 [Polyporus brumalis]